MVGQCFTYPTKIPFVGYQIHPHNLSNFCKNWKIRPFYAESPKQQSTKNYENVINENVDGSFSKIANILVRWPIGKIRYNRDLNLGVLYIARYILILAEEK